jgi:alkylation response protein AidB-like acyl-CoA dehydrogenase
MDFDFSPEQKMFKEQLGRTLGDVCSLKEVRRILEGPDPYSDRTWQALCESGMLGAAIPEEYGGLGLSYYELCVAAEEIGRALAPTPVASTVYLAAELLKDGGSDAQKGEWLPRIAAGEVSFAISTNLDGAMPLLVNGRLEGQSPLVADASGAAAAIVPAREGDQVSLFLVLLDAPSVQRAARATVDPSSDVGSLTFAQAAAERLGGMGQARALLRAATDRAAILLAFEQVGGADRALAMARDYALERKAFGRAIGSYQAIKHKLANVYIRNEVARAHAYYGAWALATGAPDLPLAAAAARVAATEAFAFAAQENIQTHGGMGFTWEADCHLLYRRARLLALRLGSALEWKERLARELEQQNQN